MRTRISFTGWAVIILTAFVLSCTGGGTEGDLIILETTDLHGVVLPYDFMEQQKIDVSLASIASYIKKARSGSAQVILLDNGDNLQGQPSVYYYNFIDTVSPHINAAAFNSLEYDAITVGNHDIEAGHSVYDRLVREYNFPLLAANAVNKSTGMPYFEPFTIIEKKGIRVAVFGMVTPSIPQWLPPELYSGMEFRDMLETAKIYMPIIKKEKPDLIVGLFHSGWDERDDESSGGSHYDKNGVAAIAHNVPGFDVILCGHNHNVVNTTIINSEGDSVLILEGGSRAQKIGRVDVRLVRNSTTGKVQPVIKGSIVDVRDYDPDPEFIKNFQDHDAAVKKYVSKVIAHSEANMSSRDSYFGSSPFVDMVHSIQLEITGADISFSAPLSFDVSIPAGPVTVGDMFKLYRFENMLYTMWMTGSEIKKYLEYSYSDWLNTMKGPGDNLLKFQKTKDGKILMRNGEAWLQNQPYNFDSAAGIDYIVDVSKPEGKRITIKSFSDGTPFEMNTRYNVAVNSYRGNGGGGHFTSGAGIQAGLLPGRLVSSTDKDLRYYILVNMENRKTIRPVALNNWRIVPEAWVKTAMIRDYELLFGK
ncbi:MAG: bifunctional metallophosphatase/5'-nucleotidase [Bacteroidales bacterium]|nr:bifunctional metallophosphatase/5'-nucleotidase [Bacteroidales bacterium]